MSGQAAQADLASLRLQVNPDNVLQIRNSLEAESVYLRKQIAQFSVLGRVGEPGNDLVSKPAAEGFNAKIDPYWTEQSAYAALLHSMADEFEQTAKSYGIAEQQIQDSFTTFYADYEVSAQVAEMPRNLWGPR
jgi:hypothetical protein